MTLRDYINNNGLAQKINKSAVGKKFEESAVARTLEYAIQNSDAFIEGMGSAFDLSGAYYHPPMPKRRTYADDAKALKEDANNVMGDFNRAYEKTKKK